METDCAASAAGKGGIENLARHQALALSYQKLRVNTPARRITPALQMRIR
jgi:hypothetical protein